MPKSQKEVDVVFVHKDQCLLDGFSYLASALNKKIDMYLRPQDCLENIYRYPKHTKIILGRTFNSAVQQGIQLAEQLHALGFTRLYLLILDDLLPQQIPDYLIVISASEFDEIKYVLSE